MMDQIKEAVDVLDDEIIESAPSPSSKYLLLVNGVVPPLDE